jgi:hypothetical protein
LPNQIRIENIEKPIPKDNEVLIKVYCGEQMHSFDAVFSKKRK